jgi:hypothetical protein
MRIRTGLLLTCGLLLAVSFAVAQRPEGGPGAARNPAGADDFVARMMEFDKDHDGKLTRSEVTDERLHRLFDRADANKDGIVTKEELTALAIKEPTNDRGGPPGFGPPGGPPGFGPPGSGPGGRMMGPPRPGEILPLMLQNRLRLTADQKKELEDLQKEVDAKLEKILNVEQRTLLKEMRERGPGGFGLPGGGRRPGGNGPPPPPDGGPPPR